MACYQTLKQTAGFTGRTYHNLCDGTQTFIPYGGMDFVMVTFFMVILAAIMIACAVVVWEFFVKDVIWQIRYNRSRRNE